MCIRGLLDLSHRQVLGVISRIPIGYSFADCEFPRCTKIIVLNQLALARGKRDVLMQRI
jgi:hypothetical protein